MRRRRSVLPLHEDPANRFLPWIVALMVCLAALTLAAVLVIDGAVARWRMDQGNVMTVQLPPGSGETDDAEMGAAVELLRATPGIAAARPLAREELVALLEPWLGRGNVVPDLPLPRLIDVRLEAEAALDPRTLEERLQTVAVGAEIDDHGLWLDRLATAGRTLQIIALAVVAAIGAAAVGTVVFTTRTSLTAHHESIEMLHLIGAHDAFVARAFALRGLWLGFRGGLLGLSLAAIALFAVYHFAGEIEAPLLPRLSLTPTGVAALAALPLASAVIAMLTARFTVLKALSRMP